MGLVAAVAGHPVRKGQRWADAENGGTVACLGVRRAREPRERGRPGRPSAAHGLGDCARGGGRSSLSKRLLQERQRSLRSPSREGDEHAGRCDRQVSRQHLQLLAARLRNVLPPRRGRPLDPPPVESSRDRPASATDLDPGCLRPLRQAGTDTMGAARWR